MELDTGVLIYLITAIASGSATWAAVRLQLKMMRKEIDRHYWLINANAQKIHSLELQHALRVNNK